MAHHAPHREGSGTLTDSGASADRDTIAAIATAPGRGGIGIVRISGGGSRAIAEALLGATPAARVATLHDFRDSGGGVIDQGLALFFQAPDSFTGEDVLELHGHGGPAVLDAVLAQVCALGARLARPGEFTERAFLNEKLDLAQAEAVADLIDAASQRAARAAMRSLAGEFSAHVAAIDQALLAVRVLVESAIDFAEEELDLLTDIELRTRLAGIGKRIAALQDDCRQGQVLRDGLDVVIAGSPNVGKSSLMNRLLAENRAIVTDIPGTTRDLLRADLEIDGVPVRLADTAGLRPGGDAIERIGMQRARAATRDADLVLLVVDDRDPAAASPRDAAHAEGAADALASAARSGRLLSVRNKVDLSGAAPGRVADREVRVSARTGAGCNALRAAIAEAAGGAPGEGVYLARRRHLAALSAAAEHVAAAARQVDAGAGDLAAEELRAAQHALGGIVGATSVEDLLGEIFSTFCIGK